MSEDFETLRKQLGDLNWKAEIDTHVRNRLIGAIVRYDALLRRQGKNIPDEAFDIEHDKGRRARRKRIIAYFAHCLHLDVHTGLPHPRALLWSQGAIATMSALDLHWARERQPIKRRNLWLTVDDATRMDSWPPQQESEALFLSQIESAYADNRMLISALIGPSEERTDGENRAIGAAWVLALADPIEQEQHPKDLTKLADSSIKLALAKIQYPSSDEREP